tara:strand:- start:1301 stop:1624 length:324 start_codon:yes stop_codon:yes gene_type:complete
MATQQQDYYSKIIDNNDEHLYTTIYDSISGDPFRVKLEMVDHYLKKVKRQSKLQGKNIVFTGEWIPSFVKTKKEIIGSPSSSMAEGVAPQSQVKAGKRRRGRRGRKK